MKFYYKNTVLDIYHHGKPIQYDINRDMDIDLLRVSFNELISNLSVKSNSLEYWLMKISERNTLTHDLFLDFCRIHLVEFLEKKYGSIDIHTNNCALYNYYKSLIKISNKDCVLFLLKRFVETNKPYFQLLKFILKGLLFHIRFSRKESIRNLDNHTVIQTWASDSNFINGSFVDIYYRDLAQYLRRNGKKVVTWIAFVNMDKQKKAIDYVRTHHSDYLIMEDYLKTYDYIKSLIVFLKKRFFNFGEIKINEKDLTNFFHYYQKIETVNYSLLFFFFIERLMSLDFKDVTFIQHFENMIPEKSLILGVRRFLPNSLIIGYFHTTKPKNLLCLDYASNREFNIAPKPDLIIFNSDLYKDYYRKKYNNLSLYSGYAFKQFYLEQMRGSLVTPKNSKILILFSGIDIEVELLFTFINKISFNSEFLFRMHPMNYFDVSEYYSKNNYEICNDQSLNVVLSKANKVISTYSASLLECYIQGLNVGLVYDKKRLLLNPFDDTLIDDYRLISSENDMKEFLEEDFYEHSRDNIFNVDKSLYSAFLR